ncbi:MAG: hypothetical protein HQL36_10730 [Alphaproteobacteria bacterium]|nr:hypothetical protein [Alphaproteobacteria bacterium]MBF0250160.1 hypothetical protein [Alphaproteobacteria bacterium]
MASAQAQKKWRDKNRFVKTQLNVMARKVTHDGLVEVSDGFGLTGKAEAVAFCAYVARAMLQKSKRDTTTYLYLEALKSGFKRDRDVFAPKAYPVNEE